MGDDTCDCGKHGEPDPEPPPSIAKSATVDGRPAVVVDIFRHATLEHVWIVNLTTDEAP